MQELEGPPQEEVGEPEAKEAGQLSKEELGQRFDEFLDGMKNDGFPIVGQDIDRHFSITEDGQDERRVTMRNYHGYEQNVDGRVTFYPTSTSIVRGESITMKKLGRDYEYGKTEREQITINKDGEGHRVSYSLGNPKGETLQGTGGKKQERASFFIAEYSTEGELTTLDAHHGASKEQSLDLLLDYYSGHFRTMEELEAFANGQQRLHKEGINVKVENDDTDKEKKLFVITVFNDKDNPDYQFIVPKSINVNHVLAETGALDLWEDPLQPPDGNPGKSLGDHEWRTKPFENITGIKLRLIDSEGGERLGS